MKKYTKPIVTVTEISNTDVVTLSAVGTQNVSKMTSKTAAQLGLNS